MKFSQPASKIIVQLAREANQLVLSVADTGAGIPSAFLPHVFEWFRQADPDARSQAGLGLGLGIVRHLVQLHGGSVRAESRGEGRGATFTVRLPIYQPAASAVALSRAAAPPRQSLKDRLTAVRVLVVEDDDDTRELVRTTLEHAGAQVEAVNSASAARREMAEESPDVLVSDIRMPEEDGYSLIQSLRTAGVTTPAIALTANARREDAEAARSAGFQIHLAKPIDAARLVEAVATLHGQRRFIDSRGSIGSNGFKGCQVLNHPLAPFERLEPLDLLLARAVVGLQVAERVLHPGEDVREHRGLL